MLGRVLEAGNLPRALQDATAQLRPKLQNFQKRGFLYLAFYLNHGNALGTYLFPVYRCSWEVWGAWSGLTAREELQQCLILLQKQPWHHQSPSESIPSRGLRVQTQLRVSLIHDSGSTDHLPGQGGICSSC